MTETQRLKIYKAVLKRITPTNKFGICQLIRMYCKNNNIKVNQILVNDFPELKLFAPSYDWVCGFWYRFDKAGNAKRIKKLEQIIYLLEEV